MRKSDLVRACHRLSLTVTTTVAQHISDGTLSLHDLAALLDSDVATLVWMTGENSAHSIFNVAMVSYLDGVLEQDQAEVPGGITLWRPNGSTVIPYRTQGDQTIRGYADAWGCPCSTIIRCTAEYSPGAAFGAGMAGYLGKVFQRSQAHVPAGAVLFYLKG
jgi:hypothetical protein